MPFKDRTEAGRELAERPELTRLENPVVVSTPRGGVLVALVVARALSAPLDVMPVVDLSTPGKPEYVVGAVAENALHVMDADTLEALGVTEDHLAQRVAEATAEIARLARVYRGVPGGALSVAGRTVVVADDGSATAPALRAVAAALMRRNAQDLTLATPLAPDPRVPGYARTVSLHDGTDMAEVGLWYEDRTVPSDEAAGEMLRAYATERG